MIPELLNLFGYMSEYHKLYIKNILVRYMQLYKMNPEKYGDNSSQDEALNILNGFLKNAARPKWFDVNNPQFLKECYFYIQHTFGDINSFKTERKYELLFPQDIISDKQKAQISELLKNPVFDDVVISGNPIRDLDINYISKAKFNSVINLLNRYIK